MKSPHVAKKPKVTLQTLSTHLGLAVGTISATLNGSPASRAIPEQTKKRILQAAEELNYQPNYFARSLRLQRTYTIGVIAEQVGDPYGAVLIGGIEEYLRDTQYFFLTGVHRHDRRIFQKYAAMLVSRGVEGFITIDTSPAEEPTLPTVAIAGHASAKGVSNLILDERLAAHLVLTHLLDLGHREIAFLKGQATSSDAAPRWAATCEAAMELGITIRPELVMQIEDEPETSPRMGYPAVQQLIVSRKRFTAIVAYNDLSALGALRALRDAGLRVPEDVSVVGFDDIPLAEFSTPELTTIRQPLHRMGRIAAETVIGLIERTHNVEPRIIIEPELIVRASTGRVRGSDSARSRARARTV